MRWSRVDNPAAFCRRVLHNIVIDRARALQRRPKEIGLFDTYDSSDPRAGDPTAAVELRPALLAALGTLTPQQRAIVVLRYFDDRSEAEVAELLDITYQDYPGAPTQLSDAAGTTQAQYDAMPTGTAALRAYLLAQARQQNAQAEKIMQRKLEQEAKKDGDHPHQHDPAQPLPLTPD
jgi:hypothetical protein